jgi:hypothetical protein
MSTSSSSHPRARTSSRVVGKKAERDASGRPRDELRSWTVLMGSPHDSLPRPRALRRRSPPRHCEQDGVTFALASFFELHSWKSGSFGFT